MTELRDIAVPSAELAPAPVSKPQSVTRVILTALIVCAVVGFLSGFTVGFLFGFFRAALKLQNVPSFDPLRVTCTAMVIGAILLTVAALKARKAGNISAGLGNQPVSHPVVIGLCAIVVLAYGILASVTFVVALPAWVTLWSSTDRWVLGLFFLTSSVISPLAEELFFRGWLWTALRQHWGQWATALFTSGLWLVMHLENGLLTIIFLIPMAVILGLTRGIGGSVRASLIMHCIYNMAVAATLFVFIFGDPT
jgi:membrane protease YdiL (CAAX protease family)